MLNKNYVLTTHTAQISSHWFLMLAFCLVYCNYPRRVIIGQIGQYMMTIIVWSPIKVSKTLVWTDRSLSLYNMLILGKAHRDIKRISYIYMFCLLTLAVSFKLLDWHISKAKADKVTIWYLVWHINIFVLNLHLMMY